MNMEKKLGMESAFPYEYENRDGTRQPLPGMSKRFYAACAAMQGLLSADAKYNGKTDDRESLIKDAYAFADELLKQENL